MKTIIVKLNPDDPALDVSEAASLLKSGRLVAFPTETVYGLGADAFNKRAIQSVYAVKGRPQNNPLIIHISEIDQLYLLTDEVSDLSSRLIRSFWPGPLTLVFKKRASVPDFTTAGLDTVAVRMPSHPIARALIKAAGVPIAAPSANLSGKPSPTRGEHVIADLSGKVDMIIDSGPVMIGLESTVLDVSRSPAAILRPGGVTYEAISAAVGRENVAMTELITVVHNTAKMPEVITIGDKTALIPEANTVGHNIAPLPEAIAEPRTYGANASPRSHATVKRPRSHATVEIPRSHATVERPRSHATVETPRSHATVETPRAHATVERPRSHATVETPRSPGMMYKHYAPNAPMLLMKGSRLHISFWLEMLLKQYIYDEDSAMRGNPGFLPCPEPVLESEPIHSIQALPEQEKPFVAESGVIASDELLAIVDKNVLKTTTVLSLGGARSPEIAAERLYGALRELDAKSVRRIYCELYEPGGIGAALADRMTRAASSNVTDTDAPVVLFVCTGNTCRSAMAEALFNHEIKKTDIDHSAPFAVSAGVFAADGAAAAYEAEKALELYGADLSKHRSQPLDSMLVMQASLILAMTTAHKEEILRRYPSISLKLFTMSGFMRKLSYNGGVACGLGADGDEISDPFGLGADEYRKCAAALHKLIVPLAHYLKYTAWNT